MGLRPPCWRRVGFQVCIWAVESGKESGSCTRFLAGTVVEVSLLGNEASRFYRFLLGKRQDVSR